MRGLRPDDLQALVSRAVEPVLKPRLYHAGLALLDRHRARGDRLYLVSATIEEVVSALASELGFDGALGTVAEVADGRYTGRALLTCLGEDKLEAVRRLAETDGIDVTASTAYSDSSTDLPFLEAVGNPVAVNPDRQLRLLSRERGWPVLEFRQHLPTPRG